MSSKSIYVTQSFLPPFEEYNNRLQEIWESGQLTNQGKNVLELEQTLKNHLGVNHLAAVCNGTIALQVAFKALELKGDVITTPFSYVATVSSLVWEGLNPVFVDIKPDDLCIDPAKIEAAITKNTSAILATHVYGFPCNVEAIEVIAKKHNLKVIYDAAHAYGVKVNGKSILEYGDISTLSFHATKVFHSGEGGAITTPHANLAHKIAYLRNFGHNGPEAFWGLGVNAKMSELHGAMGLSVFPYMSKIIEHRKQATQQYNQLLANLSQLTIVKASLPSVHNYSYYPVLFNTEAQLLQTVKQLNAQHIFPRRYFYPTLGKLPYLAKQDIPIAASASQRVLCLPLSSEITKNDISRIANIIQKSFNN